ncbi:hypothetical protein ACFW2K_16010 [Streptomyces nigra]|uniref:hypothetical protein n=1 Tax=Streptomyces nigra TaxID=1827580 RepID=UPI0036439DBD
MGEASHTVVIEVIKYGNLRRTSLRSSLQGVPDEVAAELAHGVAVMGRALTDGFRVAAAAGDDTDFDRYAGHPADALESLISARPRGTRMVGGGLS